MNVAINFWAVLVAAVGSMVVGSVWYGPLFGKQWMKLSGLTEKDLEAGKKDMPKTYGLMYVSSLVMACVLGVFLSNLGITDMAGGAMVGFWAWLGFVATVMFGTVLFEKKSMNLYFLNAAYQLVTLVVMGAILGAWR